MRGCYLPVRRVEVGVGVGVDVGVDVGFDVGVDVGFAEVSRTDRWRCGTTR